MANANIELSSNASTAKQTSLNMFSPKKAGVPGAPGGTPKKQSSPHDICHEGWF